MSDEAESPHGLMVLHIWIEPEERLRARITRTGESASAPRVESYAATKAEIMRVVETWIDGLVTPL